MEPSSGPLGASAGASMNKRGLSLPGVAAGASIVGTTTPTTTTRQADATTTTTTSRPQGHYYRLPHHPLVGSRVVPSIRKHSLDSKTTVKTTTPPPPATSPGSGTLAAIAGQQGKLVSACDTLVFACQSLAATLERCLPPNSVFGLIQPLHSISRQLETATRRQALQWQQLSSSELLSPPTTPTALASLASQCVLLLMDTTRAIHAQWPSMANQIDAKRYRQLLLCIHGVTVDIKDAWLVFQPWATPMSDPASNDDAYKAAASSLPPPAPLTPPAHSENGSTTRATPPPVPPLPSISSISSMSNKLGVPDASSPPLSVSSSTPSPSTSPFAPQSPLIVQLNTAVHAALNLHRVLADAIAELRNTTTSTTSTTSTATNGPNAMTTTAAALDALHTQTQLACQAANHLQTSLNDADSTQLILPHQCQHFADQVHDFLKLCVALLRQIRALSTDQEVTWPKPVKQGCLHMTRITTEVARLWNSDPFILQHGFSLGKPSSATPDENSAPTPSSAPP
ncbi:hypothetical protein BC940DRAFT_295415 [Gongronella butleri]|nr:hypothetical protein BC940DRAFT_295415 [Gongronella butleri]